MLVTVFESSMAWNHHIEVKLIELVQGFHQFRGRSITGVGHVIEKSSSNRHDPMVPKSTRLYIVRESGRCEKTARRHWCGASGPRLEAQTQAEFDFAWVINLQSTRVAFQHTEACWVGEEGLRWIVQLIMVEDVRENRREL